MNGKYLLDTNIFTQLINPTRLQTLLAVVVLLGAVGAWFGWQVSIVRERTAIRAMLRERNIGLDGLPGQPAPENRPTLPWYRRMLGDSTTALVYIDGSAFSTDEIDRMKAAFPEVRFVIVGRDGDGHFKWR